MQVVKNMLLKGGIVLNGSSPCDIVVHDVRMFDRVFKDGSLGLGESYMDGWWDAEKLDEFFYKVFVSNLESEIKPSIGLLIAYLKSRLINFQTLSRSRKVAEQHYDIGNDLYTAMLDKRLVYTCGYWKNAQDLDQAQEDKLELVCQKLHLKPGMTILDIGCGWGSFAKYAAEKHDVKVVGVTISKEQVDLAKKLCAGLPVEILLQDYRDVKGVFDRIVSLGMFEHVGYKNYEVFMSKCYNLLHDDGLLLLHTIGGNRSQTDGDAWLNKYIFPNSMLPSMKQIAAASEGFFVMEDWHNFSAYYDKTLLAWFDNFEKNWHKLEPMYGKKFYRMWKYYLLSCAALFRARRGQLWQVVFSKYGVPRGYTSIR